MKKLFLSVSVISICLTGNSQHTFSIVAVDSITGEIGSAGATCLSSEDGAQDISDIVLGLGVIHTQAYWTTVNQNAANARMVAGDSPAEIITWLQANDNNSQGGNISDRQYGVVDLYNGHPRSAAYTGTNNWAEKGHRIGPNYAIQGNVLISEDVLDDMETVFLNTSGSLCDKLMAVLQAAKRPGADSRCLADNISSGSAFIRVAKPTDTNSDYGNLWLDLNVWLDSGTFTGDPIDELQIKFDEFKTNLSLLSNEGELFKIYPNPTKNILHVQIDSKKVNKIKVQSLIGDVLIDTQVSNNIVNIDLSKFSTGVYLVSIYDNNGVITTQKIAKH
jgi:uncharacterized Ntn-hydrolase superfamily protein